QHWDLAQCALRLEVERERPLERRERELVRAHRALQRMAPQTLDELRGPDDDPRLWPAEELVAREADELGAGLEALPDRRLVLDPEQRSRSEIVDERQRVPLRDLRQLRDRWLLREPDEPEVRLVHPQHDRGVRSDRPLVVGRARPVRRPDLDEAGTGAR